MIRQLILQVWLFTPLFSSIISIFQVTSDCIDYATMDDLDLDKLNGTWWEYQSFNTLNENEPHDCLVANFYPENESLTIIEDFISIKYGRDETKHKRREYTVTKMINKEVNMFEGLLPSDTGYPESINYKVLYTDYNNWLVVYMCSKNELLRGGFVLTRRQRIAKKFNEYIETKLRSILKHHENGFAETNREIYTIIKNDNCKTVDFPTKV